MPCRASTMARNADSMSSAPVFCADLAGRAVGDDPALAHQQQPVAAVGLVHHVAGDEHRRAVVGEPVEQRPQVAAQHRVEADGRLVEHQQVRASRAARRRGWPASAGRRRAGRRPGPAWSARSTASTRRVHLVAADAEHPGEEREVLGDGEVVVHAGGLGDVADPVAQRGAPGLLAERPRPCPPASCWTPTRERISVDLPQPGRPEQPGDPAADREVEGAAPRARRGRRPGRAPPPRFSSCDELCA